MAAANEARYARKVAVPSAPRHQNPPCIKALGEALLCRSHGSVSRSCRARSSPHGRRLSPFEVSEPSEVEFLSGRASAASHLQTHTAVSVRAHYDEGGLSGSWSGSGAREALGEVRAPAAGRTLTRASCCLVQQRLEKAGLLPKSAPKRSHVKTGLT